MITSLLDIAEKELRKLIIQGDLALGQKITESELARRLGMSKTPVHEALKYLHREGLVQVRARQGTFVFDFTEDLVGSLLGVRAILESHAIEEAVRKNRGRLLHGLGENLKQTVLSGIPVEESDPLQSPQGRDGLSSSSPSPRLEDAAAASPPASMSARGKQAYSRIDAEFHSLFFRHAGNQFLNAAFRSIDAHMQVLWRVVGNASSWNQGTLRKSVADHELILQCLHDDDLPAARANLLAHIDSVKRHFLELLSAQ